MNRSCLVGSALILALCACGQQANTRTTAITPAPVESGPLHPMRASGSTLHKSAASLHCRSSAPVWATSRTKVYYVKGDRRYGRTDRGGYICERDAVRDGYHAAKK
jgi:hypothetical protein